MPTKKYLRKPITLLVVFICLSLSLVGSKLELLENTLVFSKKVINESINQYTIDADFDPVEKIISASQTINYVNKSETPLDALYLHLYPNAFKSEKYLPFEKNELSMAYPDGFEEGNIEIYKVTDGQNPLNYVIMGLGDSILKVHLDKELDTGEGVEINIDFQIKIPPSLGRFGYGEKTINIANWYPILSVYDKEGWNLEPYHAIGDPFYSDVGNYRVTMSIPGEYIVATTGEVIKKEEIEGKVLWTIEGKNVRDFTMVLSEHFKILADEVDGIKIYTYYIEDEFGDFTLNAGREAIRIFNETFGMYPYAQFSVVETDYFVGGMEYPNLVFIDKSLYTKENSDILEYVIVHEAAHQWWYGLVGNDQVNEPWLDEALTEYSTLIYYEKKYGVEVKEIIYRNMIENYYQAYKSSHKDLDEKIFRRVTDFKNSLEYQVIVYYKGAMFIEELRKQLGDELFFQAMKIYFDKFKYKNATTADFLEVCEKVSDRSLEELFEQWLRYEKE